MLASGTAACPRAPPFHPVEIYRRDSDRRVVVGEWHAADCPHLRSMLTDDKV